MIEFLKSVFHNYTESVFLGHEPIGKGHEIVGGGFADRWSCYYGGGETNGENVLVATVYFGQKISLFICGDYLRITDARCVGKTDVYVYENIQTEKFSNNVHRLEDEVIQKVLKTKFTGQFWRLVQKRAMELYGGK